MRITRFWFVLFVIIMVACGVPDTVPGGRTAIPADGGPTGEATRTVEAVKGETTMPTILPEDEQAFAMNARIGRAVNLGNALEAPREGEWGVTLDESFFPLIREQGFTGVRIPIRWSAHAAKEAPYTIDPAFLERVDWAVDLALKNDLVVIINMHHYEEIFNDPAGERERFLAMWKQIGQHYAGYPDALLFEPLNEPNNRLSNAALWNTLAGDTLSTVRASNPDRVVVIGPIDWNSVHKLNTLKLPEEDRRIIATFHYYLPFHFTHQGAEWAENSNGWLGTTWDATDSEQAALRHDLDIAAAWSKENRRPVLLGEFGAYSKADMESRARWTAFVAREAEARGFSWAYWEFCAGFGVYDRASRSWVAPLLEALIPPS